MTSPKNKSNLEGYMNPQGTLLVLSDSKERTDKGEVIWRCVCGCGRTCFYPTSKIKKRATCGKCKKAEREKLERSKYEYLIESSKSRRVNDLSRSEQIELLDAYLEGRMGHDLDSAFNLKQGETLFYIRDLIDRLDTLLQLNMEWHKIEKMQGVPEFNMNKTLATVVDKQLERETVRLYLSEPDSEELTPHELAFAWLLFSTGHMPTALKESEMIKALGTKTGAYVQLLGQFLLTKPNIKAYVDHLRDNAIANTEMSKTFIQNELVEQIIQLKNKLASDETPRTADRGYLISCIQLLGKTMASFTDKIQVEEINHGEALDTLIEMSKEEIRSTYKVLENYDESEENDTTSEDVSPVA